MKAILRAFWDMKSGLQYYPDSIWPEIKVAMVNPLSVHSYSPTEKATMTTICIFRCTWEKDKETWAYVYNLEDIEKIPAPLSN